MSILATTIQYQTGSSSQCNKVRKRIKVIQTIKKNRTVPILRWMIAYIENQKDSIT